MLKKLNDWLVNEFPLSYNGADTLLALQEEQGYAQRAHVQSREPAQQLAVPNPYQRGQILAMVLRLADWLNAKLPHDITPAHVQTLMKGLLRVFTSETELRTDDFRIIEIDTLAQLEQELELHETLEQLAERTRRNILIFNVIKGVYQLLCGNTKGVRNHNRPAFKITISPEVMIILDVFLRYRPRIMAAPGSRRLFLNPNSGSPFEDADVWSGFLTEVLGYKQRDLRIVKASEAKRSQHVAHAVRQDHSVATHRAHYVRNARVVEEDQEMDDAEEEEEEEEEEESSSSSSSSDDFSTWVAPLARRQEAPLLSRRSSVKPSSSGRPKKKPRSISFAERIEEISDE